MRFLGLQNRWGPKARSRGGGFTLVEVMVASAIIGLVVVSLYAGMTSCLFRIRMARENLRATQVMLEKMEVIRLLTWSQVVEKKVLPTTFTDSYEPNNTNNQGGLTYTGTITITDVPASMGVAYASDLRLIKVQVKWNSDRLARVREMTTLYSRYGVQNYHVE